ncbi:unnamed protein product, partial [marine sediment metagenome]
ALHYLNLSSFELDIIKTGDLDRTRLERTYGMDKRSYNGHFVEPDFNGLSKVSVFVFHTGLSRNEINELVTQGLSIEEIANGENRNFYINAGDEPLFIDFFEDGNESYEKICNLSEAKLNRIHRFIRLAKKLNWSFEDLDWVLKSLGITPGEDIDENNYEDHIKRLATIKEWENDFKVPLDVLTSYWYIIKNIGKRIDNNPQDLFNRTFNNPDILEGAPPYDLAHSIEWNYKDPEEGKDIKNWLLSSLEINDEELNLILEKGKFNDTINYTINLNHEN